MARQTNQARLDEEKKQLTAELSNALSRTVHLHGKTLITKMQQTVYKDAYGTEVYDKFIVECDYFIKTVMLRGVPPTVWSYFFNDLSPRKFFQDAFDEYRRSTNVESRADDFVDPNVTPLAYEVNCALLLNRAGWATRVTKASGDQGVDVIAEHEGQKLVLQCKRYSKPVGNAAVQEVIAGRQFERAQFAAVVANAGYTASAQQLAAAGDVYLLHPNELMNFHERLGITTLVSSAPAGSIPPAADSGHQLATESNPRPLNEIIQQAELLMAEIDQLGEFYGEEDPLYAGAVDVVLRHQKASVSLVQRTFRIGYNRAARLLEDMEKAGVVSSMTSSGQRDILVSPRDGSQGGLTSGVESVNQTSVWETVRSLFRH